MKSKWILFPLGYFKAQLEGFHRLGSDFTEHLTHLSNFLLGHVGYHGSRAFSRFTVDTCGGGGGRHMVYATFNYRSRSRKVPKSRKAWPLAPNSMTCRLWVTVERAFNP